MFIIMLKKSIHDPRLLFQMQLSKQLGNDKPKFIVDIETRIWNAVKKISSREMTAVDALQELISSLPKKEISNMQKDDPVRTWFKPTPTGPSITLSLTPSAVNESSSNLLANNEEQVDNDNDISMTVDSTQTIQNRPRNLQSMHCTIPPHDNDIMDKNEGDIYIIIFKSLDW